MSTPWSRLVEIREEIPVTGLGASLDAPVSALPLIGESPQSRDLFALKQWFKIAPHQFLHTRYDVPPLFVGFAWAPSDGAFASALTRDSFFDDKASLPPPAELLPDGKSFAASSVARIAKESGERSNDVILGCIREIYFGRFRFYYRSIATEPYEPPICIRVVPKVGVPIEGA